MIRVADYIAQHLLKVGVRDVFMLTGGGAMHLNDALGNVNGINVICNHHEQACAIAAEGYARASGRLAVVNVTTGPGGLNTLTGVMGQWTDSVPVLYLSGQVRYDTTVYAYPALGLRQIGDQEICIANIVKPMTKMAVVLKDPLEVKAVLAKAIRIATHGRPGPVWIDVPMNVQSALVDPERLAEDEENEKTLNKEEVRKRISVVLEMLASSTRPALIAGHGIRLAKAEEQFYHLVEELRIPVLSTFNGFDLMETDNPHFIGRIGTIGNRSGNFVLQNADLVLCLGSRNNIRQVSYNWDTFARSAKKIVVDIDESELDKPTVKPDLAVRADLAEFIPLLRERIRDTRMPDRTWWNEWSLERKRRFPTSTLPTTHDGQIDPYFFCRVLSEELPQGGIVVTGNATPNIAYFQSAIVKRGQRVIWNSGCASMGYDLPAAIGACFALGRQDTVCLAGDGSLQLNIQELATVAYHGLPIKIFCFNNNGYISIRQTQDNFFPGRKVGTDPESGVGFPDLTRVAKAYDIPVTRVENSMNIRAIIRKTLDTRGPAFCEVVLPSDYVFAPKLSSEKKPDGRMISKPLEDMYPFLDREEFHANMIVKPLQE